MDIQNGNHDLLEDYALLTIKQVCAVLQCSRFTLEGLFRQGYLTKIKLGYAVRVPSFSVKNFIKSEAEQAEREREQAERERNWE